MVRARSCSGRPPAPAAAASMTHNVPVLRGQWWRGSRPALAGAIAIAVIAAAVGGVWLVRPHLPAGGRVQSASVLRLAAPARSTAPLLLADRSTPGPTVTPTPSPSRSPAATAAAAAGAAGAPAHLGTLPPGSALPGDA